MKRYTTLFRSVIIISFIVLSWVGMRIYQQAPPIPDKVVTTDGNVVFTKDDILTGQNVWQALGGMEVGSVWGHGSYVAPDWSADWLHRKSIFILNYWGKTQFNKNYDDLGNEQQATLKSRLEKIIKTNTFNTDNNTITIDPVREKAIQDNTKHFTDVFLNGKDAYAIRIHSLTDPEKLRKLSAFFFWTSWAASTNRPNDDIRSEEHTSELQSLRHLVCRLLLEKKK